MFLLSDVKWNKTGNSSVFECSVKHADRSMPMLKCALSTQEKCEMLKCALSTQENQMWILSRKKSLLIFKSEVIYWSLQKSNLIATIE